MAAVFQIVDGMQTVGSGCLRGLKDTRIPMLAAAFGYWGIGFPTGYLLAFHSESGHAGALVGARGRPRERRGADDAALSPDEPADDRGRYRGTGARATRARTA